MCYTAEDSLRAYAIGVLSSLFLFLNSTDPSLKVIALFLAFVAQMQILDYGLWQTPTCDEPNEFLTKIAITINHLQPIVLTLLQIFYRIPQSDLSMATLALYFLALIPYSIHAYTQVRCTLQEGPILHWKWNYLQYSIPFYSIFLLHFITASMNFPSSTVKILAVITSLLSFFVALKMPFLSHSMGRAWCYLASVAPLIFYVAS